MPATMENDLTSFQQWVLGAFNEVGMEPAAGVDPLGLEFTSDNRVARVLPHADTALAVIEVEVRSLSDADALAQARVALLAMRLNDEARFEHAWQIVLDEEERLCISSAVVMSDTSAEALVEVLADGLARATILGEWVDGVLSLQSAHAEQSQAGGQPSIVRG